jgi:16S rRNA (adenine1518-N6/adenine1519-N6)-dimethyltransferase
LREFDIHPRRSLGQHFLHDLTVAHRIIDAAKLSADDTIIEVGPGIGVLTVALARAVRRVIAIEKDEGLIPVLRSLVPDTVAIIESDALDIDPGELVEGPYRFVANLPYNVATAILRHYLDSAHRPLSCTFMVQLEVARRIVARPPQMSILSVALQFHGQPRIAFKVGRGAFIPPPNVTSAVVHLDVSNPAPLPQDQFGRFFELVRAGFGNRRKLLRNALTTRTGESPAHVAELMTRAGIGERARAQELDVPDWLRLYEAFDTASHGPG